MNQALKNHCKVDLSFPFHDTPTISERLEQIRNFTDQSEQITSFGQVDEVAHFLEQKVAQLMGKPAAMWCPSGTLAQGIAARIHMRDRPDNSLLLHPTSHLLLHEQDGIQHAHQVPFRIAGTWRETLTVSDLNPEDAGVFVELPQRHSGGKCPDWQTLVALKRYCAQHKIPLHMDGARLWSCRPFYDNRSYQQIVSGFDSVYLSFYKDIGALGGAMLLGSEAFIQQACVWRSRFDGYHGGYLPMILDTLRLLDKRLNQMDTFVKQARLLAASISENPILALDPQVPHTNMFHVLLPVSAKIAEQARDKVAQQHGIWLSDRFWSYESDQQCAMEMVVGEKAMQLNLDEFQQGITSLLNNIANTAQR